MKTNTVTVYKKRYLIFFTILALPPILVRISTFTGSVKIHQDLSIIFTLLTKICFVILTTWYALKTNMRSIWAWILGLSTVLPFMPWISLIILLLRNKNVPNPLPTTTNQTLQNESLQQKASFLVPSLIETVQRVTDAILKFTNETKYTSDKKASNAIFIETLLLYFFICDRLAFEELGPAKKSVFIEMLTLESLRAIKIKTGNAEKILELYNLRSEQYSQYKKFFAENNESLQNTLFWEYAKTISEIVTKNKFSDILISASTEAALNIMHLNIRDLLKK